LAVEIERWTGAGRSYPRRVSVARSPTVLFDRFFLNYFNGVAIGLACPMKKVRLEQGTATIRKDYVDAITAFDHVSSDDLDKLMILHVCIALGVRNLQQGPDYRGGLGKIAGSLASSLHTKNWKMRPVQQQGFPTLSRFC
jgi:hypothetical protein